MPIEDVEALVDEVRSDLVGAFDGIFETEGRGFETLEPFVERLVQGDGVSVLAWVWHVRHVGPIRRAVPERPPDPPDMDTLDVQFIPATERSATIHGVTVIDESGGEAIFTRFIDWLGLYAELGAVTMARPLVDERPRP